MSNINKYFIETISLFFFITACLIGNYVNQLAVIMYNITGKEILNNWYLYSKIGAILFIASVTFSVELKKVFSLSAFRWLNKISFPVFMFHRVVEGSIGCFVFLRINSLSDMINAQRMAFIATIVTLIFVSVFYSYIIEPLINRTINKVMQLLN